MQEVRRKAPLGMRKEGGREGQDSALRNLYCIGTSCIPATRTMKGTKRSRTAAFTGDLVRKGEETTRATTSKRPKPSAEDKDDQGQGATPGHYPNLLMKRKGVEHSIMEKFLEGTAGDTLLPIHERETLGPLRNLSKAVIDALAEKLGGWLTMAPNRVNIESTDTFTALSRSTKWGMKEVMKFANRVLSCHTSLLPCKLDGGWALLVIRIGADGISGAVSWLDSAASSTAAASRAFLALKEIGSRPLGIKWPSSWRFAKGKCRTHTRTEDSGVHMVGNLLAKINQEALGRTREAWGGNIPTLRVRLMVLLHQRLVDWPGKVSNTGLGSHEGERLAEDARRGTQGKDKDEVYKGRAVTAAAGRRTQTEA